MTQLYYNSSITIIFLLETIFKDYKRNDEKKGQGFKLDEF
jgi:hypothetical protein